MSETVCLDASFALTILLGDPHRERAIGLWDQGILASTQFMVPPLFQAETTSVIRERVYRGQLPDSEASKLLADAINWPAVVWPGDNDALQRRAFEMATRFNRPKAYDAQYLAVADLLGCQLWTADRRLAAAVSKDLPWVRYIGEAV